MIKRIKSLWAECKDDDVSIAIILTPFETALGAVILIVIGILIAVGAMWASVS